MLLMSENLRKLCVILLLIGASLSGCDEIPTPATEAVISPWSTQPNAIIVFTSKADSASGEIYLVEKDGAIRRLTHNERYEDNLALSPDGNWIAFHAGDIQDPLSWEITIMEIETGEERQLTDNRVIDAHPDWSPDGSRLVFSSFRTVDGLPAASADIFSMNVDGTGLVQLTDSPYEDNDPTWSPDGALIAFKSTRTTQTPAREEIFIMRADGSDVHQLSFTAGWESDHDPSWAPDGSGILFSRFEGTRAWTDIVDPQILGPYWRELMPWNVYCVNLDLEEKQFTDLEFAAGLPTFNAYGSKILYHSLEFIFDGDTAIGADHYLMLMNPDGTEPRALLDLGPHVGTLEFYDW